MRRELIGLTPRPTFTPVGGLIAVGASVALATLPVAVRWEWALIVAAPYTVALVIGGLRLLASRRHPVVPWRLDEVGLGRHADARGRLAGRPLYPIDELGSMDISLGSGTLTVFDRDGFRIGTHGLAGLGLDLFPFWLTARQLGITVRLTEAEPVGAGMAGAAWGPGAHAHRAASTGRGLADTRGLADLGTGDLGTGDQALGDIQAGDSQGLGDGRLPVDGRALGDERGAAPSPVESAFLALEAGLLKAQHSEPVPPRRRGTAVVYGRGPERLRSMTLAIRRTATAALGAAAVVDIARPGQPFDTPWRALAAAAFAVAVWAGSRLLRTRREASVPRWAVSPERVEVSRPGVGSWQVAGADIAAVVPLRGLVVDPVTGRLRPGRSVHVFDHLGRRALSLPCDGVDRDELSRVLRGRGVTWVELGAQRVEPGFAGDDPGYGLEALPEIFQQAPHGRLSVDADGLHWFDEGAGIRLTIESEQVGAIQLHTRSGHAWVRFRDRDGDVMLEAPLRALRIARTELREAARRAGLTVVDPEYDAFSEALFHRAATEIRLDGWFGTGTAEEQGPSAGPGVRPPGMAGPGGDGREAAEGRLDDLGLDDLALEDLALEDLVLEDLALDGLTLDGLTLDGTAFDGVTMDDLGAAEPPVAGRERPDLDPAAVHGPERDLGRWDDDQPRGTRPDGPAGAAGLEARQRVQMGVGARVRVEPVELPATLRARGASFVALPVLLSVLAAVLLLSTAGTVRHGGGTLTATIVLGALMGLMLAAWLDARRLRIRVSSAGVCAVSRRGVVAWQHERDAVGAIGVLVVDRAERLVVWSTTGSEMRREYLDVDAEALRDACERHGIPWGRPRHTWEVTPPPEL